MRRLIWGRIVQICESISPNHDEYGRDLRPRALSRRVRRRMPRRFPSPRTASARAAVRVSPFATRAARLPYSNLRINSARPHCPIELFYFAQSGMLRMKRYGTIQEYKYQKVQKEIRLPMNTRNTYISTTRRLARRRPLKGMSYTTTRCASPLAKAARASQGLSTKSASRIASSRLRSSFISRSSLDWLFSLDKARCA